MLLELNPDVNGEYIEEDASNLIDKNIQCFLNFSVVISCGLKDDSLKTLSHALWEANIPLLICTSYGLIGKSIYC